MPKRGPGRPRTTGSDTAKRVSFAVGEAERAALSKLAEERGLGSVGLLAKQVTLALLLIGCAPEIDMSLVVDAPSGADAAERLILERFGCDRATVWWYGPQAFTCNDGKGFPSPISGACVDGTSWGTGEIVVGLPTLDTPIWKTALTHEYAHRTIGDSEHTRANWWGANGEVVNANAEIRGPIATRESAP